MKPSITPGYIAPPQSLKAGDIAFARMEKVNAELVAMTYGALVSQIFEDKGSDIEAVNQELFAMGKNMGLRMIDEFLAKYGISQSCQKFKEAVDVLARIAMKMFLGIDAEAIEISESSLLINFLENPLNDFVELPSDLRSSDLHYSNLYCGIAVGAFEMLRMNVRCEFVHDVIKGDTLNTLRVDLVSILREEEE